MAAIVIGIGTWYVPFGQSYEVQNAAKLGCNDVVRQFRFKLPGEDEKWRENFLRRAQAASVKLKPNQYSFKPSHDVRNKEYVCNVKINYVAKAEVAFIGDYLEIEPFNWRKEIVFEQRIKEGF